MKKLCKISILFLLMMSFSVGFVFADEAENEVENIVVENETTTVNGEGALAVAYVLSVSEVREENNGGMKDSVQDVTVRIEDGEYKTQELEATYNLSYDIEGKIKGYPLKEGDKVQVQINENGDSLEVTVIDFERNSYLLIMVLVFFISVILIGGKAGVKAILGLVVTGLAIYFILIKSIFAGADPVWTSVGTTGIIIVATFIIIGGLNKKILTASIGTLGGVILAGVTASIFNYLCRMSGAGEDAIQLSINMTTINFDFKELLFAGIIISALGACMDVGMSIASSLDEIKSKTPDITYKELFKSGMNIGKDVIGTMTNTLILAYVGGSITLILLFMACNINFADIVNKEMIAQEIISAIAGSMGVLYTVPITSIVYSVLNKDKTIYRTVSENKVDGKRSLKI